MSDIFAEWMSRLSILRRAHREAARHYSKNDKFLGGAVVVFSAIVGSAVFGTIGSEDNIKLQFFAGGLSLASVVLASLQTFFDFSERSNGHRQAAVGFSGLAKELQVFIDSNHSAQEKKQFLETFRAKWDSVESEAPILKTKIVRELEEVSKALEETQE